MQGSLVPETRATVTLVLPRPDLVRTGHLVSLVPLRLGLGPVLLLVPRLRQVGLHGVPVWVPKKPGCELVGGEILDVLFQGCFVLCSTVLS